ncbi:hypothetical protein JOD27_000810 [Lentzea nigeriaca]|nr:hypothetical protein [Lentzea nigeriaca]
MLRTRVSVPGRLQQLPHPVRSASTATIARLTGISA